MSQSLPLLREDKLQYYNLLLIHFLKSNAVNRIWYKPGKHLVFNDKHDAVIDFVLNIINHVIGSTLALIDFAKMLVDPTKRMEMETLGYPL